MNPNFASITQRITDAQSYYNALQLTAQKQFSHGCGAALLHVLEVHRRCERNQFAGLHGWQPVRSGLLRPQSGSRLSAFGQACVRGNWSYELPFAKSMTGLAACFESWQLNSITTVQTGHPFEVRLGTFNRSGNLNTVNYACMSADVNPAYTGNPILGGPARYWDINAFVLQPAGQRGNEAGIR